MEFENPAGWQDTLKKLIDLNICCNCYLLWMMVYVLQGLCIQNIINHTYSSLSLSHQEVLVLSFHITPLAEGDEC